jgi:hypothetical protein
MDIWEHDPERKICPMCGGNGGSRSLGGFQGPFILTANWTLYACCDLWRNREKEEFFIAARFPKDQKDIESFSRDELERLKKMRAFQ